MEPEHKRILKEKSKAFEYCVSLEKIKPLLLDYKIFNKYMWEDIHSVSDVFDLLPSRGPNAFQNIIDILRTANYRQEADILENIENINNPTANIPSKLIYKLTSDPLGYCLIINNVTFAGLEKRLGSDVDCKALEILFKEIGYDVCVESDLSTPEMYNRLEEFSYSNFKDVDSAILIIMSHGAQFHNDDVIFGTDGQYIRKKHVIDFFSNINCPQLQGKPKVFFFLVCRGENKDYGALKVFPSESADSAPQFETIPSFTDILIVHSTLPNNISMRDHEKGSWFCQDLVTVLKDNHAKYDVETNIKMANNLLKKRISLQYRVTQAAHCENMAFNSLILCRFPVT